MGLVLTKNTVDSGWKRVESLIPRVSYLGIDFACNVARDVHAKRKK